MFRRVSIVLGSIIAGILVAGCGMMGMGAMGQGPTQTMSGTLHSVRPVGGGEPTGWVLTMGPEGQGSGMGLSLDVSKVKKEAMELDGKQVSVQVRGTAAGTYQVESFGVLSPSAKP